MAAQIAETLARAVSYAHQQGIVHRDLKPENVLLAGPRDSPVHECTIKIADFGLARQLDKEGPAGTGIIAGTPSYMAPEQAEGKGRQIGPLADVYAVGAILYEMLTGRRPFVADLYEMLTGRPPFVADDVLETLRQVIHEEPVHPRRLQPKAPSDLETICLQCLRKEPTKRYVSAQALADDLGRWLEGRPIQARPVGQAERLRMWCRRNRVLAGSIAIIAILLVVSAGVASILAVWALREKSHAEQSMKAEAKRGRQAREALDELLSQESLDQWLAGPKELLPQVKERLQRALTQYEEFARDTAQDPVSRSGVGKAYSHIADSSQAAVCQGRPICSAIISCRHPASWCTPVVKKSGWPCTALAGKRSLNGFIRVDDMLR